MSGLQVTEGLWVENKYSNGNWNYVTSPIKLCKKADFEKEIRKINPKFEEITTDGKIWFFSDAVFPRQKLSEVCKNKICRKIEDAEYIVLNSDSLSKLYNGVWERCFYLDSISGKYSIKYVSGVPQAYFLPLFEKELQALKIAENLKGKKFLLDTDLSKKLPRTTEVKGDFYKNVSKMLSANDKDTVKLGVTLLTNINYDEYSSEVALMLNQYMSNIRKFQVGTTVAFKTMLNLVSTDYPEWDNNHNTLEFILSLAEKSQHNEKSLHYINEYFSRIYPLGGNKIYYLQIRDKGDVENKQ